jgi:putative AbiEi antitoxin of type IV toxin-antitoxin system
MQSTGCTSAGARIRPNKHDAAMDDLRAICAKATVFLRSEALAAGYDDGALRRALKAGVLHRVRHGAYVFAESWNALDEREQHLVVCASALRTTKAGAVLSHVSAVAAFDLPLWEIPLDEVHLTRLDRYAGRSEAGIRQHRGALSADATTRAHGLRVTTPVRTALDLTTLTDVEHALPVLSEMLRRGLLTKDALAAQHDGMRHVPGTLASRIAIGLADGRLESVGECRSWHMFYCSSLPMPVPQYEVFDRWGVLIGRVDFAWPELGLFVEFDGKEKYLKYRKDGESVIDAVRREKRREEQICRATGWRCVRLTWADLYRPAETCALIREMFRQPAS